MAERQVARSPEADSEWVRSIDSKWSSSTCVLYKRIQIAYYPNCTGGGGGASEAPLDKCWHTHKTAVLSAAPLHDFLLWSLANILTPSLQKLDRPLRSHVTFCDQRSIQKVRIFSFRVQNKWQSEFFILACKSVVLSTFCFVNSSKKVWKSEFLNYIFIIHGLLRIKTCSQRLNCSQFYNKIHA